MWCASVSTTGRNSGGQGDRGGPTSRSLVGTKSRPLCFGAHFGWFLVQVLTHWAICEKVVFEFVVSARSWTTGTLPRSSTGQQSVATLPPGLLEQDFYLLQALDRMCGLGALSSCLGSSSCHRWHQYLRWAVIATPPPHCSLEWSHPCAASTGKRHLLALRRRTANYRAPQDRLQACYKLYTPLRGIRRTAINCGGGSPMSFRTPGSRVDRMNKAL